MVAATEQADLAVGPELFFASALDCLARTRRHIDRAEHQLRTKVATALQQRRLEEARTAALRCFVELTPGLDEFAQGHSEVGRLASPASLDDFQVYAIPANAFDPDETCDHLAAIADEYNSLRHVWLLTGRKPQGSVGRFFDGPVHRAWLFVEKERGR